MGKITLTIVRSIAKVMASKKAKDITIIDLRKVCSFASFFIIATASSNVHTNTLRKTITQQIPLKKIKVFRIEGAKDSNWILIDCGDLIVHIFGEKERKYYNLERLWAEGKVIKIENK